MEPAKYYSREVCAAIAEAARDREVAFALPDGRYGTRPNVIKYPRDVEAMLRDGAVSFHGSIERWRNPLELSTELPKFRMEELRIGWDFIIDIDCNFGLEFAKKTASVFLKALDSFKIADCSLKFSGNRGFHIGVPFEVFPEEIDGKEARLLYPGLPKKIVEYLKGVCVDKLRKEVLKADVPKPDRNIEEVDPYAFVDIDSGVFSSRHMFRMPYCLHQKTGLVSLPIRVRDLDSFQPEMAKPENVSVKEKFLEREVVSDATELVRSALFHAEFIKKEEDVAEKRDFAPITSPVQEFAFPPCIKKIASGLSDGKKRSAFVLSTFLLNIGWNEGAVLNYLREWNKKNEEPLRDNFLLLTLKSQTRRRKAQTPPNCGNESYYKNFGVCLPDGLCAKIKNPLSYALARTRMMEKGAGRRPAKKSKAS